MNWLYSYVWPQKNNPNGTSPPQQPPKEQNKATTPTATTPTTVAPAPKNGKTTPSKQLAPGPQAAANDDNNQYENMNDFDQKVAEEEAKLKAITDLKDQQNKFIVPKDQNKKVNPYDLNYDTLRLGPTEDQVFAKKDGKK